MTKTHSTASEIQDIAKSITCLASRLQLARRIDPSHAVAVMSIIASRYRQAIESARSPHLIAELPGNAALWKAMAAETGSVDENLYDRLKTTVSRAITSVYPDIARFAVGVDASLMAAAKLRRSHDSINGEIQFAVDTGKARDHKSAPLWGLREALLNGGVSSRKLASVALEAIHDVVFSHTLSDEEGIDFMEHSLDDALDTFDLINAYFDHDPRHESIVSVIRSNFELFGGGPVPSTASVKFAA
jgi:hypothetical protein